MSENDPQILVRQLLEAAQDACSFVEGYDRAEFLADVRTQKAVAMNLIIIGEAVTKLSKLHPHFVEKYPDVPWRKVQGMRNRIAHGYFDLDMNIVWDTVSQWLPELLRSFSMPGQPGNS